MTGVMSPTRASNVKIMIRFYQAALKRGRGMPTAAEKKEREQVSRLLEKIEQHEKAIAQLLSHSQRDREEPSLSQSAPGSAEKIQKVQVAYRNTFVGDIVVRTRKQAAGPSAQHCSRRHLKHLLPDCRDFDIQNACFSLLSQLVDKMCPRSPIPSEIAQTLQELATNRDECAAKLGLTKAESKQLLLEVFNGSQLLPPWDTHDLLKKVQRTSIYCRWLAPRCRRFMRSALVSPAGDSRM